MTLTQIPRRSDSPEIDPIEVGEAGVVDNFGFKHKRISGPGSDIVESTRRVINEQNAVDPSLRFDLTPKGIGAQALGETAKVDPVVNKHGESAPNPDN
jgi:hypothetical protein